METNVVEIMSSIQGEGLYVGCRQLFVRFQGCNLKCKYCDTANSIVKAEECIIEKTPGSRDFYKKVNPINKSTLLEIISKYDLKKLHSISYTGGEPLLQHKFLGSILPDISKSKIKNFLETNGTLTNELTKIIDYIDIVSMDIKLPDAVEKPLWEIHRDFLKVACSKDTYVKIVITSETNIQELDEVISIIDSVNKKIPLIIQPVTPIGNIQSPISSRVISLQDHCLKHLNDVRVIPQTHKYLGQL